MRAVLICLLLTHCAPLSGSGDHNPRAVFDAYLIAHGMAKSYDERADADPAISQQLATLDARARGALVGLGPGPDHDPDATARAVAELTEYAARQTEQTR
jgi:hypothetical protein